MSAAFPTGQGGLIPTGSPYPRATYEHINDVIPRKSHLGIWMTLGLALLLGMATLGFVTNTIKSTASVCSESCPPPSQNPLHAPHRYTSSAYGYSLEYFDRRDVTLEETANNDTTIGFDVKENPVYSWSFTGMNPNGRSAQQIVRDVQSSTYPDATLVYTIPQAEIGYTPGYGNVYDDTVYTAGGDVVHVRIYILAAIKNGVAVEMDAVGAYKAIDYGHPNPSLSPAPVLFDPILDTVTWKNEPPL